MRVLSMTRRPPLPVLRKLTHPEYTKLSATPPLRTNEKVASVLFYAQAEQCSPPQQRKAQNNAYTPRKRKTKRKALSFLYRRFYLNDMRKCLQARQKMSPTNTFLSVPHNTESKRRKR